MAICDRCGGFCNPYCGHKELRFSAEELYMAKVIARSFDDEFCPNVKVKDFRELFRIAKEAIEKAAQK